MKLIYLTVATIPNKTAHSKYVMKLCEAFANQGIDTALVSCTKKENIFNNVNSYKEFKVKNNFKLKRFVAPYTIFKKVLPNGLRFRYYNLIIFFYILYLKLFNTDIVFICHNHLTAKVCEFLNVKYIIDLHDNFPKMNINPMFIIVQSEVLYKRIKQKYKNNNIFLSRNAVSKVNDYLEIKEIDKNNKKIKFCYVGRLEPYTGFNEIVEAINMVNNNFIIYVGGDYDRYKDYYSELFIKFPNAKNKIIFLGYLNDFQINYLTKESDVLIALYSSSISIFGTMSPMKIFEYLRFNKKIIAPKVPDIEEIVNYYDCEERMEWYKIDDVESLKNTIQNILEEKQVTNLKSIDVETWDVKARNILRFINIQENKFKVI